MDAKKLQVKLFVDSADDFDLEPFIPVLHDWIKDDALGELVIDVADYMHVPDGPGLLLVGHYSDYYLDLSKGRPGLLYSRKRGADDDAGARVLDAIRRALFAAQKLQSDNPLKKPVSFRGDELLFRVNDRLRAKNDDATFERTKPTLETALQKLYGDTAFTMEREGDPRELFTVRVKAPGAPGVDELLKRLN